MNKTHYAKIMFNTFDDMDRAKLFGLTSIENEDLTLKGLIAKMIEWDEQEHGVEAYIYDMTKKDIENLGGQMPNHIRRVE